MKVVFVTNEIFPYSKTGELEGIGYALPKALKSRGVDIECIAPICKKPTKSMKPLESLEVVLPAGSFRVEVFVHRHEEVNIYFLSSNIFECKKLYGSYPDNYLRFGLFCYAASILAKKLGADIIHLNDWQTSLCAYLIKRVLKVDIASILTIHNIAYQGVFSKEAVYKLGLLEEDFNIHGYEFYAHINFLKAGIVYADSVTTVSKSYLEEIQSEIYGFGLDGVVREYIDKFRGIANGIDCDIWNPAGDSMIAHNYNSRTFNKKKENKNDICKLLSLKEEGRVLFIMIGRLVREKGVDFIKYTFPYLRELDANFVLMGECDQGLVSDFKEFQKESDNFVFIEGYDEGLAHKLYAAADFLIMPSLYESCGLNQLIAYKYGTIPIVRRTGGLKESVCDYGSKECGRGIGVVFEGIEALSFYHALSRALALYTNGKKMQKIARSNMGLEVGWDTPSSEYIKIYKILSKTRD